MSKEIEKAINQLVEQDDFGDADFGGSDANSKVYGWQLQRLLYYGRLDREMAFYVLGGMEMEKGLFWGPDKEFGQPLHNQAGESIPDDELSEGVNAIMNGYYDNPGAAWREIAQEYGQEGLARARLMFKDTEWSPPEELG